MSGGGGTQKQVSEPWKGQKGPLLDIYGRAGELSQTPTQFFPGQTFANLSPQTEQALQMQEQRALAGSPVTAAMQTQLTDTLGGKYLDPTSNPAFGKAAGDIAARVGSTFSAAGRYGSGAQANQHREALSDLAANTYESERARQMQGMLFAPQAAAQDYVDAARLAEVGGVREDFAQQGINDARQRFEFEQMEPWQRLQMYSGLVTGGGSPGGTVTQTGGRRNLGAGALGGAATGASIGSIGGPWGAGIGAGIGGLLGLFG